MNLNVWPSFKVFSVQADQTPTFNAYRLMAEFFDPVVSERWQNPTDHAHKTFVVLASLDQLDCPSPLPLLPHRL